ncbi:MAG: 3-deoxy-manno-octulosonate cytidylyltransferase [Prolixibacteraceae bacterium]|nr:3-deoxy-manno-octulosonate cytidylyltransferase [Prolixibacteraceae bacterium]
MKFITIIPARYESTRFPGKPLVLINNKPMIEWVYKNVADPVDQAWVATDDDRIYNAVKSFGGNAIKTSSRHQSGTDRCAEAALKLAENIDFDVVINVQGDEPFVKKEQIELLKSCFSEHTDIATLIKKIESIDELFNQNRPKVVVDKRMNALYFSRSPIPFVRHAEKTEWLNHQIFWAHIGMYAYRKAILQKITKLEHGNLECAESLEQLRWIENGFKIKVAETTHQSVGIDTPDDLDLAVTLLKSNQI